MKIQTKYTNIESTEAIQSYLEKRVNKLEKIISDSQNALCSAELAKITKHHKEGDIFKAELNILISGKQFFATSEKDDLYAAIDEVKDEVEREILSSKEKRETLIRKGGKIIKNLLRGWGNNK